MLHLCQFWLSKLLIKWYLVNSVFLEQGGMWWQYGTHKWYAIREGLGTTVLRQRVKLINYVVTRFSFHFKITLHTSWCIQVDGIACITALYVHSDILPTFHRRCYWFIQVRISSVCVHATVLSTLFTNINAIKTFWAKKFVFSAAVSVTVGKKWLSGYISVISWQYCEVSTVYIIDLGPNWTFMLLLVDFFVKKC